MQAKADLHVHSRYSDRPSEWLLRRLGAPESFTDPQEIYRVCKARGMAFVTISDHNRIDGAMEIAHHPDTFISCEVTTYFPEDGCKVHVLVTGITPAEFKDIDAARPNIYDLRTLLVEKDILHSVAHLLYAVNGRLTVDHIEKLLVLFNRFETLNGTNHRRADQIAHAILTALTPGMLAHLADKHRLTPVGPEPWRKTFTGGSDDHSGLYIANAYTLTPPAANVTEFLEHLRAGRHAPAGVSGTSLRAAHAFYQIGYGYYHQRLLRGHGTSGGGLMGELLRRFVPQPGEGSVAPRGGLGSSVKRGVKRLARRLATPVVRWRLAPRDRVWFEEVVSLLREAGTVDAAQVQDAGLDEHGFQTACRVCHRLGFAFVEQFVSGVKRGEFMASLEALAALGPVALAAAPYVSAFKTLHKDQWLMQTVSEHFPAARHLQMDHRRRAWVGGAWPAPGEESALDQGMLMLARQAAASGERLTRLVCGTHRPVSDVDVQVFTPVGQLDVGEAWVGRIPFPPFLEVIRHVEQQEYGHLYLATPDAMGLSVLWAGRLLGLRLTGLYQGDYVERVLTATGDEAMAGLMRRYLAWFYDQMDVVFVNSEAEVRARMEDGISPHKLQVLPPWDLHQGRAAYAALWGMGEASGGEVAQRLTEPYRRIVPGRRPAPVLLDAG